MPKEKKQSDKFYTENKLPVNSLVLAVSFVGVFLVLIVTLVVNNLLFPIPKEPGQTKKTGNEIIMKVGEENIYQKDKDFELSQMPKIKNDLIEQAINQKLITDSIILQQAQKEKMVTLDSTIYNNNSKNYQLRIKAINRIKENINDTTEQIEGNVVTVWYYNSIMPKMGIERAKEITRQKIAKLHKAVVAKEITITQAIESIKADTSLKEIDGAYVANAGNAFKAKKGEGITLDENFDKRIWELNAGGITEVSDLKNALYAFAKVETKTQSPRTGNFSDWLENAKTKYEVVRY